MLDEAIAVAGRLAGVWRFSCPKCGHVHRLEQSIKRCADKLAHVVLGNDVRLSFVSPIQTNEFQAAKKGLRDEFLALTAALGGPFSMPVNVFVRAESLCEATLLMLEEFQKFITVATATYKQSMVDSLDFKARMKSMAEVALGAATLSKNAWSDTVRIGNAEFSKIDIIQHYLDTVPRPSTQADKLGHGNKYDIHLSALEADENLILLCRAQEWYGIKVTGGVGKFVHVPARGSRAVKMKRLRDA